MNGKTGKSRMYRRILRTRRKNKIPREVRLRKLKKFRAPFEYIEDELV